MLIVKNSLDNIQDLIISYEKRNGFQIPEQLRKFLIRYNGGQTPKTSIKERNISTDIRCLYGFSTDKDDYENVSCIEKNGIRLLPFGKDSFGNEFLIEIDNSGTIYFMNHEKNEEIVVVSDSFYGFIRATTSEKINEASKRTPEERERILVEKGKGNNITDGLRKMWQDEYNKFANMIQEEVIL